MQFIQLAVAAVLVLRSVVASESEAERSPFPNLNFESTLKVLAPDEVWGMVVSTMFDERVVSLAPQDPKSFLKEVYRLPIVLAYLTRYAPFMNMALDTELFSLVRLAKVLRRELYLVFEERIGIFSKLLKCTVLPRSKLTVNYLNAKFFRNHLIDIDRRRRCFSFVANKLFYEKEVEVLNLLISVVSDDILKGWWMTEKDIPFILHAVTTSTALRLCRLAQGEQRAWIIASVCLARGEFSSVEHFLTGDEPFISGLERALISIASEQSYTDYFSQDRELRSCMPLLNWLSERKYYRAPRVRLLYLIRESSDSGADSKRVSRIQDLPGCNIVLYDLFLTVLCAQNQELLTWLLSRVFQWHVHQWKSIAMHQNIGTMLPFDEYMTLMDRMATSWCDNHYFRHQRMLKICKTIPGAQFADEWIGTFPDWYRLVVLATIGDEGRFEAAIGGGINDARTLMRVMYRIVDCVDDPVPFVGIILRMGFSEMYSDVLGQKQFLRSLLLSVGRGDVFELVSAYEIILTSDFLEALLEEHDLREAFEEKSGQLRISVEVSGFSAKCVNSIVELLSIMRVPINNDAFSLLDASGAALDADTVADRVEELEVACTLWELTNYARKPGFLACVALVHIKTDLYVFGEWNYEKFKKLDPLRFLAFELLRQWYVKDRVNFIKSCNCCVVLMFFAAKIDEATWAVACAGRYTATIKHVAAEMSMSLVFSSEREMERFKSEVLSVLDVADRVQCRVESSDWDCIVM